MENFFIVECINEDCGHEFITNDTEIICCSACGSEDLNITEKLGFVFRDIDANTIGKGIVDSLNSSCVAIQDEYITTINLPDTLRHWFKEKGLPLPKSVELSVDTEYGDEDYEYLSHVVANAYNDEDAKYYTDEVLDELHDFLSYNLTITDMHNNEVIYI